MKKVSAAPPAWSMQPNKGDEYPVLHLAVYGLAVSCVELSGEQVDRAMRVWCGSGRASLRK